MYTPVDNVCRSGGTEDRKVKFFNPQYELCHQSNLDDIKLVQTQGSLIKV